MSSDAVPNSVVVVVVTVMGELLSVPEVLEDGVALVVKPDAVLSIEVDIPVSVYVDKNTEDSAEAYCVELVAGSVVWIEENDDPLAEGSVESCLINCCGTSICC